MKPSASWQRHGGHNFVSWRREVNAEPTQYLKLSRSSADQMKFPFRWAGGVENQTLVIWGFIKYLHKGTRLLHVAWGNCKTKFISCRWPIGIVLPLVYSKAQVTCFSCRYYEFLGSHECSLRRRPNPKTICYSYANATIQNARPYRTRIVTYRSRQKIQPTIQAVVVTWSQSKNTLKTVDCFILRASTTQIQLVWPPFIPFSIRRVLTNMKMRQTLSCLLRALPHNAILKNSNRQLLYIY